MKADTKLILMLASFVFALASCSEKITSMDTDKEQIESGEIEASVKDESEADPKPQDFLILDDYKVKFGEYEINGVLCVSKEMPEHLKEPAMARMQEERIFKDGTTVSLNQDMTYFIKEADQTISTGTYKIGIRGFDICLEQPFYYPGRRSFKGYLNFTDESNQDFPFEMHITDSDDNETEYGKLWIYEGFEIEDIIEDISIAYTFGLRYGLSYCQ